MRDLGSVARESWCSELQRSDTSFRDMVIILGKSVGSTLCDGRLHVCSSSIDVLFRFQAGIVETVFVDSHRFVVFHSGSLVAQSSLDSVDEQNP